MSEYDPYWKDLAWFDRSFFRNAQTLGRRGNILVHSVSAEWHDEARLVRWESCRVFGGSLAIGSTIDIQPTSGDPRRLLSFCLFPVGNMYNVEVLVPHDPTNLEMPSSFIDYEDNYTAYEPLPEDYESLLMAAAAHHDRIPNWAWVGGHVVRGKE